MYGEQFKSLQTFGIVDEINKRYAEIHDASTVAASTGGEVIDRFHSMGNLLILSRHQQPNGAVRWGPGIKEMDATEEDYFDRDEDETLAIEPLPTEEEVGIEKSFELKRRPSPDDEGEDELLQLAHRSPAANGIKRS